MPLRNIFQRSTGKGVRGTLLIDPGKKLNASLPLGGKKSSKRPDHLLYTPRLEEPLTITNQIARTLYRWMFSWSQAGFCNTEDEYVMSKMLLLSTYNHQ